MAKKNTNLHAAKNAKNDEFYTRIEDIEKELANYKEFFNGKVVLCNCDDPLESNFTKYFILNFHHLGLKKLICTFYDINGRTAYAFEYEGDDMNDDGVINEKDIELIRQSGACRTILVDDEGFDFDNKEECWKNKIYGSGDFRSKNVIDYLKESDVVVTNPPFSLFKEYVQQLLDYKKYFLIIGPLTAIGYKEIFPNIKENKLWLGITSVTDFLSGKSGNIEKVGGRWFTNIEHKKRTTPIEIYAEGKTYPHYENLDGIDVKNIQDIPLNYVGKIGLPLSLLDVYCPTQFRILALSDDSEGLKNIGASMIGEKGIELKEKCGNQSHISKGSYELYFIENGQFKRAFRRIIVEKLQ